jgi:hypothetical protein
MSTEINVPEDESFRNHIRMVLSYMLIHFAFTELGELPELGLKEVIDQKIAKRIFDKMNALKPKVLMKLSLEEALNLYAAHVCMSILLVSKYDKTIATTVIENLPDDHEMKSFEFFRSEMLDINSHFIRNVEKRLSDKKELHILKSKLAAIRID